ncbi:MULTISPECIES: hypothetical protein [Burkholderia]|uniref:hypothetical protein n=1 Tax=Burkholderia TaxID=32008 RepID=UPI00158A6CDB|nr:MULTISPECIES: hypothetical protein [Burkholderia]MBY4868821.1 hypothetical protein [Burkholderia anthina]
MKKAFAMIGLCALALALGGCCWWPYCFGPGGGGYGGPGGGPGGPGPGRGGPQGAIAVPHAQNLA